VYVLAGPLDDAVERELREASRARVPIVCVREGGAEGDVPYVLATDVIEIPPGHGFPIDRIAGAVARRLGEKGSALAARAPVLRRAVCAELIRRFSVQDGIVGAAFFIPGTDLPVLFLNQARLVLRIADAYGQEIDANRLPELLAVLGAGFGLRTVARELLDLVPFAGWAVKGVVAYAGTRALGEAAVRYFEARTDN
jgi:uncharacterized protein (DUF697 family)